MVDDCTLFVSWVVGNDRIFRLRWCILKDYRAICVSSAACWENQVFPTRVNAICWPQLTNRSWLSLLMETMGAKLKSGGIHRFDRFNVRTGLLCVLDVTECPVAVPVLFWLPPPLPLPLPPPTAVFVPFVCWLNWGVSSTFFRFVDTWCDPQPFFKSKAK